MRKKALLAVGAVAVVGGVAFGADAYMDSEAKSTVEEFKARHSANYDVSYASVDVSLLDRQVNLEDFVMSSKRGAGTLRADIASMDLGSYGAHAPQDVEADNVSFDLPDGGVLKARRAEFDGVVLSSFQNPDMENWPRFDAAKFAGLRVMEGEKVMMSASEANVGKTRTGKIESADLEDLQFRAGPNDHDIDYFKVGSVSIEDYRVDPGKADGSLESFVARDFRGMAKGEMLMRGDRVSMEMPREPDANGYRTVSADLVGLEVREVEAPKAERALSKLGYDRIVLDAGVEMAANRETGKFEVRDLSVSLQDGFKLTLRADFEGLPDFRGSRGSVGSLEGAQRRFMKQMRDFVLTDGRLSFEDRSIVERIMEGEAEKRGMSAGEFRETVVSEMERNARRLQGREQQTARAVSDFVSDPGTLVVSASPDRPVPVAQAVMMGLMGGSNQLPKVLNLEVSSR